MKFSACLSAVTALIITTTNAYPPLPPWFDQSPWIVCKSTSPYPDLLTATFEEISSGLDKGLFTAVELTQAYIARIQETQPILKAIIEVNPHALTEAAAADAARQAGSTVALLGIPIIVKDNIATARPDQSYMNTTAGSFALLGSVPQDDSTMVKKLKAAGAIILAKANLSQWANYRSTNATSGWTSRGGQCTSPYWPLADPGGSSSGSGVAASVGLAVATLGSETSGSIISPASNNAICGIKPTVGLTSRHLVIPISQTQDTIGAMAGDCKTAASILGVIAGQDPLDNYTSAIPFGTIPDYAASCTADGLKGARIGIPSSFVQSYAGNQPEIKAFNHSFNIMRSLGATVMTNANFPVTAVANSSSIPGWGNYGQSQVVLGVDFLVGFERYTSLLASNPQNVHTVPDLINFTESTPAEDYPDRNVKVWQYAVGLNLTQDSPEYTAALEEDLFLGGEGTLLGAMDKYDLDALILPSNQAWGIPAIAGYPAISVPLGYYPSNTTVAYNSRNTLVESFPRQPFGLTFIGRKFSEEKLISLACAYEAATQVRARGQQYFVPTMQIGNIKDPLLDT